MEHAGFSSSTFAGTTRDWWVYVPAQYSADKEANLLVFQDGAAYLGETQEGQAPPDPAVKDGRQVQAAVALDNLHHTGEIPLTIAVFIQPGVNPDDSKQRSFEYDSTRNPSHPVPPHRAPCRSHPPRGRVRRPDAALLAVPAGGAPPPRRRRVQHLTRPPPPLHRRRIQRRHMCFHRGVEHRRQGRRLCAGDLPRGVVHKYPRRPQLPVAHSQHAAQAHCARLPSGRSQRPQQPGAKTETFSPSWECAERGLFWAARELAAGEPADGARAGVRRL